MFGVSYVFRWSGCYKEPRHKSVRVLPRSGATVINEYEMMRDWHAKRGLSERLTGARQPVQDPRSRQRCLIRARRGRFALDLVVQAGLGKEGYIDYQCVCRCWPCDERVVVSPIQAATRQLGRHQVIMESARPTGRA